MANRRLLFVIATSRDVVRMDLERAARDMLPYRPTMLLPADYIARHQLHVIEDEHDAQKTQGLELQGFWTHSCPNQYFLLLDLLRARRFIELTSAREAVLWLSGS